MKKRITEIEIEKRETLVVRLPRQDVFRPRCAECGECGATETMISPTEAAAFAQFSQRAIFRLIEAGAIHFAETAGGEVYVCLNSFAGEKHSKVIFQISPISE